MHVQEVINEIDRQLPAPPTAPGASLLMMVGLPGAGKSSIVQKLRELIPFAAVTTDLVRVHVCDRPTYSAEEVDLIYEVCYGLIRRRLARATRVVFDASNALAARRQRLFTIAAAQGAPVAVCRVQASEAVTRERLARRQAGERRAGDWSDAGWSVYQWMVDVQEPLVVPHLTLDTTETSPEILASELYHYWLSREQAYRAAHDKYGGAEAKSG